MLARRLTPVLALAAMAGLAASGCASQAVGVQVGDQTYSEAAALDELDAWGENEELFPPGQQGAAGIRGELGDSYSQDAVAEIIQQRINFMFVEQLFDEHGLELTADDRQAAEDELVNQYSQEAMDAFPDDYQADLVDDFARLMVLGEELGQDGLNEAVGELVRSTDIELNPRFGEWDENQGIVPPDGPRPAPGQSGPVPALSAG